MNTLRKKIMRRIYYAYVLRMITATGMWQGGIMMLSMILLTRFVSLGNVLNNFMHVEVSRIGIFMYNALSTTEVWTLILLGLFVYALYSFKARFISGKYTLQKNFI